jgi:hypothetical protein
VFGAYGYRAIVLAPDDTLNSGVWFDRQWPEVIPLSDIEEETAQPLHPEIENHLIEEAKAKISDPEIEGQWELIYRVLSEFGRWALSTPTRLSDFGFRLLILALVAGFIYRVILLIEIYLSK